MSDTFVETLADAIASRLEHIQGQRQRLFTLEQAAVYLGMSERTVSDLVTAEKLKSVRLTRRVLFDVQDLDRLIESAK